MIDSFQNRRLIKETGTLDRPTSDNRVSTGGDRPFHQPVDVFNGTLVDHGPARDRLVKTTADLDSAHGLSECRSEFWGNTGLHVEAICGCAGFRRVPHFGDHGALDGGFEIGVVEHDEGGIASEFHHGLEHTVRATAQQHPAYFGGTSERNHAGVDVVHRRVEPRPRVRCRHDVDQPWW